MIASDASPVLCSLFASVLGDARATYIATPITGGRRFYTWRMSEGLRAALRPGDTPYEELLRHHVIRPNLAAVRRRIAALRKQIEGPVIDPSVVEVPGWSQQEYRTFWGFVIERFASAVVLLDEWQFSQGCTHEWDVAARLNLPIYDQQMNVLLPADALAILRGAVQEIATQGLDASVQREVIAGWKESLT
jgi:hypothetical protein